jgi:hypothetical protein
MKKQLLILFVLIFIAGFSSYAQIGPSLPNSTPRPFDCQDDAGHPIAGKQYTYEANATPAGGDFTFWATKDENFITTSPTGVTTTNISTMLTTPTDLLSTSANYGNANTLNNVQIIWSDAVLSGTTAADPTFVAVHYSALAPNCADNFKAWSILPIKAFTVDIKNIENAAGTILAYDEDENQCMDIVRGATYNAGTINYNFGTQVLYFEVVAANFSDSWTPTFTLTGLGNGQTAVTEYTVTPPPFTGATWVTSGDVTLSAGQATDQGVSIYVRVTVTNNTYEGIASTPISLAVDGQNSVGEWDIVNNDPAQPGVPLCIQTTGADQMDVAVQTLDPRPAVTPVTPPAFVPGNETN